MSPDKKRADPLILGSHLYRFTKCFPTDKAPECRSRMDAWKRCWQSSVRAASNVKHKFPRRILAYTGQGDNARRLGFKTFGQRCVRCWLVLEQRPGSHAGTLPFSLAPFTEYHLPVTNSPGDRHVGYSQFRAVANKAALTLADNVFVMGDALVLLGKHPGAELLGHHSLMKHQCFRPLPILPPEGLLHVLKEGRGHEHGPPLPCLGIFSHLCNDHPRGVCLNTIWA